MLAVFDYQGIAATFSTEVDSNTVLYIDVCKLKTHLKDPAE